MLLKISTTHRPATDLGYLLHKHPDRAQVFDVGFGDAHVFYTEANDMRTTANMLLDVDPVRLVRSLDPKHSAPLHQYVNDRPYVSSSFMSVAMGRVFSTAISGICKMRPELVETAIPLEFSVDVVSARGGEGAIRAFFEPLGYTVEVQGVVLDSELGWEHSSHYHLSLSHTLRLSDALSHLFVLLPALDDSKHYYVADDEVEKLLRHGEGWLSAHPQHEEITRRYLERRRVLVFKALDRLVSEDEESDSEAPAVTPAEERRKSLHDQRLDRVLEILVSSPARSVLDLGCGEGKLLRRLVTKPQFQRILGLDVSHKSLEIASRRLRLNEMSNERQDRLQLVHGSLLYRDKRLEGFDAAALVEVIEHLDEARLSTLERNVFEFSRPGTLVVTTPNVEYNAVYADMEGFRHSDHRFEWTRVEFESWAKRVATFYGYSVEFEGIGEPHEEFGAPSQAAVFRREV